MTHSSHRLCIAPMMDVTDRHQRYLMRQITARARLYTEMVTADAVLHGDRDRLLGFDAAESPVALQLGGHDPEKLARAAAIGAETGYDEINLNVGCPSDRVQSGRFGACLMAESDTVAECVAAMRSAVTAPVTVKCRLGIDDQRPPETLPRFIAAVADAGCDTFIVHARKAWLKGLNPKQNRDVPPLDYALVQQLKRDHPELRIVINGGIDDLDHAQSQLDSVDGVMIGRAARRDPWALSQSDSRLFGDSDPLASRRQLVERMLPYVRAQRGLGVPLLAVVRHMLPLFQGCPGARAWRRHLSENAHRGNAGVEVLTEALSLVTEQPQSLAA